MRLAAAVCTAVLGACASPRPTRPLDRTRPVEIREDRWRGPRFEQDGVPVAPAELWAALDATPAARERARSSQRSAVGALGLLCLGVGAGTVSLFVDDPDVALGLQIGALGAGGGSLYLARRSESSAVAAVRTYNASLPSAAALPSGTSSARPLRARLPAVSFSLAF